MSFGSRSGQVPSGSSGQYLQRPDPRLLPRLLTTLGRPQLAAHLHTWGANPPPPPDLLGQVERCGLSGRGGAGFPTAVKLAEVGRRGGWAVVANGLEGEPTSAKDKTLLTCAPHLVIDGAVQAATLVGAERVVVCVDRAAKEALEIVGAALAEREASGVDALRVTLAGAPGRYVAGEESALVNWINGGPALPQGTRARPYQKGVGNRPTLVCNVETLAQLALIARFGERWFKAMGAGGGSWGSALVTVGGDVERPAVYEIALGTPLRSVLASAGADPAPSGVLLGGYAGAWLDPSALDVPVGEETLRAKNATLGCGSVVVVGSGTCGLKTAAAIMRWMASQSARQCGPCTNGLPAIAEAMEKVVAGDPSRRRLRQVERWMEMVDGRGACRHPDGAIRMLKSALRVFEQELSLHAKGGCRRPALRLPLPAASGGWR